MSKANYKNRIYHVESYDANWPKQFETDAKILKEIFGHDAVAIEHIGSTSVPGMDGKSTIDMLILVDDLAAADRHSDEMQKAGYEYLTDYVMPDSRLFRQMKDNVLLSNIHVFKKDHPHVYEMLTLRDYLRSHPEEVKEYSDLKKYLYAQYPNDYAMYRKLKDAYMERLKARAGIVNEKEKEIIGQLESEGYDKAYVWDAEPGEIDGKHEHNFDTKLIILKGEIQIKSAEGNFFSNMSYKTGSEVIIPRNKIHEAKVGPEGCRYIVGEKH